MELDGARQEIKDLLKSRTFESSETHRRLLEYLATKSLSGATDHLKEYTIGVEAFGKPSSYDPQEDSIVRTQISRLRLKLLEYYKFEGRDDPVLVEIPKGGFRLEFHLREKAAPSLPTNGAIQPAEATTPRGKVEVLAILPWVLCGILAVVCIILGHALLSQHDDATAKAPWPLSRVVNAGQQTTVVLADAGFSRLRSLSGRNITLEQYLSSDYPKLLMPSDVTQRESAMFDSFTRWPVLSQAEAETLKTLVALSHPFESRVRVRSAHDLRPPDLMDENLILLGAPTSNPWVSRFCKFLNFRIVDESGDGAGKHFLNQNPKPGEASTYAGLTKTGSNGWAYATLALLPNDRSNGGVLILQGLQREGTAAAGLFLADEQNRASLGRALAAANADPEKAWFEVLIRADSIAAVPGEIQIVAVRVVHAM